MTIIKRKLLAIIFGLVLASSASNVGAQRVNKLIELQKIDTRLLEIEEIKGDLPNIVKKTEQLVQNLKKSVDENKNFIAEIDKNVRELSAKINDSNEK